MQLWIRREKFLDPDRNDTLSYGATPSDPQVVMVDAVGSADRQSSTANHAYGRTTARSSTSTTVTVLPILVVDGGTLSVTWGRSLDTFATPLSADFAVRVNGKLRRASTIELREQRVILTLDPPVVAEDDVQPELPGLGDVSRTVRRRASGVGMVRCRGRKIVPGNAVELFACRCVGSRSTNWWKGCSAKS